MTVSDLIAKLVTQPKDMEVFVMEMPDKGDVQFNIQDVDEWDGCVVLTVGEDI